MTEVAEEIDKKLKDLANWRGETLGELRSIIRDAHPGIVAEIKWRKPSNPSGVPIWSLDGMICTGEVYRNAVKLTFAYGASLKDRAGLFNASMAGRTDARSIIANTTPSTKLRWARWSERRLTLTGPRAAPERGAGGR